MVPCSSAVVGWALQLSRFSDQASWSGRTVDGFTQQLGRTSRLLACLEKATEEAPETAYLMAGDPNQLELSTGLPSQTEPAALFCRWAELLARIVLVAVRRNEICQDLSG